MRPHRLVFLFFSATAVVAAGVAACSSELADGKLDGLSDASAPAPPFDSGGLDDDAAAPQTGMRVAHLAPDVGRIDFCLAAARTASFEGPVLGAGNGSVKKDAGTDADADAASTSASDAGDELSLGFEEMTSYLTLDITGPLTIAIVAAGAGSCANPIVVDDVTLDPGKLSTVVLMGVGDQDGGASGLRVAAFTDDTQVVAASARARMIHAALAPLGNVAQTSLAVSLTSGATGSLADRVEPRRASSPSASVPIDVLGYAKIAPVAAPAKLSVSALADGGSDAAATSVWQGPSKDLDLTGGSVHTGFMVTTKAGAFEVVWCADKTMTNTRTACVVVK